MEVIAAILYVNPVLDPIDLRGFDVVALQRVPAANQLRYKEDLPADC